MPSGKRATRRGAWGRAASKTGGACGVRTWKDLGDVACDRPRAGRRLDGRLAGLGELVAGEEQILCKAERHAVWG